MSVSPVPKKVKEKEETKPYSISLDFNEKANLIHVEAPEWMSRSLLIEHLSVATQFIAQVIGKEEQVAV